MQVILMERVANLGNLGDVVKVKDGFARNYLIPHGKAKRATPENLAVFESRRAELERVQAEALAAATPGAFLPRQFANEDNSEAHALTTGPEIAAHCRPSLIRDGVLEALVDSSVWCQQLQLRTPEILEALRRVLGDEAPTGLWFHVG